MQETPQQYIQRILGYIEGKDPLRVQQETARKLERLTKPLTRKQLTRQPEPRKWSIAQILAHLADTELVAGWRMRLILGSNGAPVHAFDQDVWAETFDYSHRDPKASLEMFRVLRTAGTAIIQGMRHEATQADIDQEVRHMQLGWLNGFMTRLTLRVLRLRAFSQDQFERLAAQSAFGRCAAQSDGMSIDVRLTKGRAAETARPSVNSLS